MDEPPSSVALQTDFVQDFLSNITTYWLWVDACQFDIGDYRSWLFATSSPGMSPPAAQCDHGLHCKDSSRQRRNDPRPKFSPALCSRFANLLVPFVSEDSRGLFTLWTEVMNPCSKTIIRPHRLPADQITTWSPTMLYVGRGKTTHKTLPASSWGNIFEGVGFRPHRGNYTSYPRPCSRPSQASTLTNAGRQEVGLSLPGT